MNTKFFAFAACATVLMMACSAPGPAALTDEEIREFATQHIESQVGYEEAVEPYKAGLSEESVYYRAGMAAPRNVNFEAIKGSWFFEDSVKVDLMEVKNYGSVASVMGMITFYNFGMESYRSFHGTVVRDGDRLRWDRWYHTGHGMLARDFFPLDSDVDGAVDLCKSMFERTLQGDGRKAGELSDSLVQMDPNMAMAHVGLMWRAWFNADANGWNDNVAAGIEKSKDAATRYFFMSHSKTYGDRLENARKAYCLAPDSPLNQVNLAWVLSANDLNEEARVVLNQATNRWGGLGAPFNLMGYLNMSEGRMDEAEDCFNMYVRLAPDVANAHDSMGDFLAEKGDNEGARASYAKAIELDPSFTASKEKMDKLPA